VNSHLLLAFLDIVRDPGNLSSIGNFGTLAPHRFACLSMCSPREFDARMWGWGCVYPTRVSCMGGMQRVMLEIEFDELRELSFMNI
jgi:hypothetical protein